MLQRRKFLLTCLIQLSLTIVEASNEYCAINLCSNPKKHVLCLYPNNDISETCKDGTDAQGSGLNSVYEKNQQHILDAHNRARAQVRCEYALQVAELKWDHDLADMAERWAKQCVSNQKDQCRSLEKFGFVVYQNVYTVTHETEVRAENLPMWNPNFVETVEKWSELKKRRSNPAWPILEHHRNIDLMGCGMTVTTINPGVFSEFLLFNSKHTSTYYIVCNYAQSKREAKSLE